jgi:hypothetical protein
MRRLCDLQQGNWPEKETELKIFFFFLLDACVSLAVALIGRGKTMTG